MIFWILAGVLTLVVALLLARPLFADNQTQSAVSQPDMEIYKAQLVELDRDEAAGAIPASAAKSARTEISRRLLQASQDDVVLTSGLSANQRGALLVLVVLLMPALAGLVYIQKGNPEYGDQPYTDRNGEAEMWAQYARAYAQGDRFADAEAALHQAIALSEPRADLYERLGEAIIFGGDGSISQSAVEAFNKALELDPARERSRYILAEWTWRNGSREAAVRSLVDLLEDTQDPAFQSFLKSRIDEALADIKNELSGTPQEPASAPASAPGPLQGMSPAQRAQVLQMVSGLATRLESQPDDLEGWLRLIRSWAVLQEREKANEALQQATLRYMVQPEAMDKIMGLAEELGLARGPDLPEGAHQELSDQ